jgi:serine/threonine-protein kinase
MTADMVTIYLDNMSVRLREDHDFRFLRHLGKVCCVFDEQDSGNICFGVATGTERVFVKYAGAKTIDFSGNPEDAVDRLKKAMPVYQALRHPDLVKLREHFAVNDGYAAVFTWFPGECLHAHWAFTPAEKYHHPESPSFRHKQLPLARRLDSLDTIFAFHEHVVRQGYVAIDFYDGSILYDFAQHRTQICDIDVYNKLPYTNTMGRMWGSTRFMSPEEFERGAIIDEVTNVFTLGATAFALLGDEKDRSFEKWDGNEALYEVAGKAVNPDRSRRYLTIASFRQAWTEARRC